MAQKIQIKRGLETNLPTLDIGEPAFTTDEHGLYVGSSAGNIRMLSEEDRAAIITDAQSGAVFADRAQSFTAAQKSQARANIAAYALVITSSSFSSLPQTISNSNITDKHVVVNSVLSNPSAQTGNWTVTTSNGSLTISGSISGITTITLYLMPNG